MELLIRRSAAIALFEMIISLAWKRQAYNLSNIFGLYECEILFPYAIA